MTHSPFACFVNRFLSPLFIGNAHSQGRMPSFDELDKDEKAALLLYVYEPHNLDDFHDWAAFHCNANRANPKNFKGARAWMERFSQDKYELVCSPSPGPIAVAFAFCVPIALAVGGVFLACAMSLGLKQMTGY